MDWKTRHEKLTGKKLRVPGLEKQKRETRYIYVFQNPIFGYHKIGLATNVKQRLVQLNRACGCVMEEVWRTPTRIEGYNEKIHEVKMNLKGGLGGDWYDCSWEDIKEELIKSKLI